MDTFDKLKKNGFSLNEDEIKEICEKYNIIELSVFGSSLRDDFNDSSDVDLLVSFSKNAKISLFDIIDLEYDLSNLLNNREVQVIEEDELKYPLRRANILSSKEVIYVAQ